MVRLGTGTEVRLHERSTEVVVSGPAGAATYPALEGRVALQPSLPGSYTVQANQREYALAVNFLEADESNVMDDQSGEWGSWGERTTRSESYATTAWFWVLLGLGGLYLHAALLARGAGR